jgi:hypothetical protein
LSEGAIPILKQMQNNGFKKSMDMSFLLTAYHLNYLKYFLTMEMAQIDLTKDFSKTFVLAQRRKLLMAAEKDFVNKLGLSYIDDIQI